MSATFSKLGPLSVGSSESEFGPHIEELRAFFKTRGLGSGSPEDLGPFVDRLESDAGFRDDVGSLMRAIIYRERDGLSWAELMELLAAAVGGPAVGEAEAPEVRESVRRLMAFVEGVFRTRRNPGTTSAGRVGGPEPEAEKPEAVEAAAVDAADAADVAAAEPPKVDMFYRARMVAEGEAAETFTEGPKAESVEKQEAAAADDPIEPETVLHSDLHWHVPFEDFEERRTSERGSPAWLWVAGLCALLLAFCAGLFVHQRLIVPLRAANTPYEAPPPEARQWPSGSPAASGAQMAGTEGAVAGPASTSPVAGAPAGKPNARAMPVGDVTQLPRYMAPATIGASPAVMAAHLVYAPRLSYPMMAEMTRIQGKVTVEAVVNKSGRVIRAQAIDGHRLLRGAAVRQVYKRRYRPYMVNDRPVDVATLVTVDFRLRR
jgi:TonB family protein